MKRSCSAEPGPKASFTEGQADQSGGRPRRPRAAGSAAPLRPRPLPPAPRHPPSPAPRTPPTPPRGPLTVVRSAGGWPGAGPRAAGSLADILSGAGTSLGPLKTQRRVPLGERRAEVWESPRTIQGHEGKAHVRQGLETTQSFRDFLKNVIFSCAFPLSFQDLDPFWL